MSATCFDVQHNDTCETSFGAEAALIGTSGCFAKEGIIEKFDADGDGDLSYAERSHAREWLNEEKGDRSCCRHHETD